MAKRKQKAQSPQDAVLAKDGPTTPSTREPTWCAQMSDKSRAEKRSLQTGKDSASEIDDIFGSKPKQAKCAGDEIDDLFGSLNREPKDTTASSQNLNSSEASKPTKSAKPSGNDGQATQRVQGSKDDLFGAEAARGRKKTDEGYRIYSEEELGFGKYKGGDTELCPFDCECCF